MRERPILFNGAMVRAILAGRKVQTRRVAKGVMAVHTRTGEALADIDSAGPRVPCPFGQPGDRLWVRERFKPVASGQVKSGYGEIRYGYAYEADSTTRWNKRATIIHDLTGQPSKGPMQFQHSPWRSAICMPHRACRLLLEITAVRVERLQAISEADAVAEGLSQSESGSWLPGPCDYPEWAFHQLWAQVYGEPAWEANPWVWVIEFKRVEVA
jgi:hypothetical protein